MPEQAEETILQFGTGKFLRCFTDLFVEEANRAEGRTSRVVAVQSTGSDRARIFNHQQGRYHVAIRGLERGEPVDRTVQVESISRALAAPSQWEQVLAVGRSESLETIVSNTTEAGYSLDPKDAPGDSPPRSFPAKLLSVLKSRFEAGLPGVTVLPCELLEGNAECLLGLVIQQNQRWRAATNARSDDVLLGWLKEECRWRGTLVDRIVSRPSPDDPLLADDPLFAVAEPFALWLIEGAATLPTFERHPAVQQVDRLQPYYLRKVRILNGAHTALVAKAMPLGFETVRQAMGDPMVRSWLRALLLEEIVPTLEGRADDPEQFAERTLERFANPFLDHRLADIGLHHEVKVQTRLVPTQGEFRRRFSRSPRLLDEICPESTDQHDTAQRA